MSIRGQVLLTGDYAIDWSDGYALLVADSASPVSFVLPPDLHTRDWGCTVVNRGTGVLSVTTTAGQSIDGPASLTTGEGAIIFTDGEGSFTAVPLGTVSLGSGVSDILPVANGGSGSSSPSLIAGSNVTISGSWPNQTIAASGGAGGGDMWPGSLFTAPPSVNQSSADASNSGGGILMTAPAHSGININALVKAMPTPPYAFTIYVAPDMWGTNFQNVGICIRDSATGKLVSFGLAFSSSFKLQVGYYTNPTTFGSAPSGLTDISGLTRPIVPFFLANPNQIGILVDSENNKPISALFASWSVT